MKFHKSLSKIQVQHIWTIEEKLAAKSKTNSIHAKKIVRFMDAGQVACCQCGLKATHVVKYQQLKDLNKTKHINLFGDSEDGAVLITVDHILPIALGGADKITNLRPMCAICNRNRGKNLTTDELTDILLKIHNHVSGGTRKKNFFKFMKKKYQPMATWAKLLVTYPQLGQQIRFA